MVQALQLHSNLPTIILTTIIIILSILAYLEYKKIMLKLDSLSKRMDELNNTKKDLTENMQNTIPQNIQQPQQYLLKQQQIQQQKMHQQKMHQQQMDNLNIHYDNNEDKRSELSDKRSELSDKRSELSDERSELSDERSELSDERSELSDNDRSELSDNDRSVFSDDDNKDDDNKDDDNKEDDNKDDDNKDEIVDITEELKEKYLDISNITNDNDNDDNDDNNENLNKFSVNELKDKCKVLNLPVSGNKTKLIKRIEEIES